MAAKKKQLSTYVRERREKDRHPYRILFHVSAAPRKVLIPRRTTYQAEGDEERPHPLLFLCPFRDIKQWMGGYTDKFPRSRQKDVCQAWFGHAHVVLHVHIVRVDPKHLVIPQFRFHHEYISRDALQPAAIVPIRFQWGKPLNLSRVASVAEQIKENARCRRREFDY